MTACRYCGHKFEFIEEHMRRCVRRPANSMLDELDAGRMLARALRRYLALADLGHGPIVSDAGDERDLKIAALDVYNALNRCEVLAPEAKGGEPGAGVVSYEVATCWACAKGVCDAHRNAPGEGGKDDCG